MNRSDPNATSQNILVLGAGELGLPVLRHLARRANDVKGARISVLLRASEVFHYFRTAFLGKASPVQFFWGSFDLAVTRFSGRGAPLHPGGVPHLPDAVVREAYSHEVSSAGFWPGGGAITYPAFYSYAYPAPDGFASAKVQPAEALSAKNWANSFCRMTRCACRTIRKRRCWRFCRALMMPRQISAAGIAQRWNARRARWESRASFPDQISNSATTGT